MTTQFVNVYSVDREYGGPEEGGWYFTTGEPETSVRCDNEEEVDAAIARLEIEFPNTGKSYTYHGGADYRIYVEDEPAKAFPEERPYYC